MNRNRRSKILVPTAEVGEVAVAGATLAYAMAGEGEAVVFVHGALGDYRTWLPQVVMFSKGFRAISYSRRGHFPGAWDDRGPAYTREQHAEDLIAVLEALVTGPAHLVGHAYGGAVAALVAARRPDLVADLVLGEPSLLAFVRDPARGAALDAMRAGFDGVLDALDRREVGRALALYSKTVCGESVPDPMPESTLEQFADNVHTLRPMIETYFEPPALGRAEAQGLRARTLFVVGALSPPLYRRIAEGFRDCWRRNARIVTLEGASHGLHLEQPNEFSELVFAYIAASPGAGHTQAM